MECSYNKHTQARKRNNLLSIKVNEEYKMKKCFVKMKDVNLYYPSTTYNATTLKEEIFSRMRLQKKRQALYDVHALKDFNLELNEGDKLGIIGHNGAGKSTLLKTIAGIYPIRTGEIQISGSIRSLFELSLGFEFEATGRENIMYRGLLLGETPDAMQEKEKQIIDFADIGDFIDYPIKAYSSGMLVRLAFAISTSIQGDIILLDEIIGAGDATFYAKAKKRMSGLMDSAKILVLVSHELAVVEELCNRIILVKQGEIIADGVPAEIIEYYRSGTWK